MTLAAGTQHTAGREWQGEARRDRARLGRAGASGLVLAWNGVVRPGTAGMASRGTVRPGALWQAVS